MQNAATLPLRFAPSAISALGDHKMLGPAFELIPRLLLLLDDTDSNCQEIADLIRVDPALTAEVLRAANGVPCGGADRTDSLSEAISRAGLRAVTRSVVKLVAATALSAQACPGYQRVDLWRHSLATAIASQIIARRLQAADAELAYTAGLLHDLGKAIFARAAGVAYIELLEACAETGRAVYEAERDAFNTDHVEVAAHLLTHWKFPPVLIAAVERHHTPEARFGDSNLPRIVHVGNAIAYRIGEGNGAPSYTQVIAPEILEGLSLAAADLPNYEAEALTVLQAEHSRLW